MSEWVTYVIHLWSLSMKTKEVSRPPSCYLSSPRSDDIVLRVGPFSFFASAVAI